jgi:hypothetical protein
MFEKLCELFLHLVTQMIDLQLIDGSFSEHRSREFLHQHRKRSSQLMEYSDYQVKNASSAKSAHE